MTTRAQIREAADAVAVECRLDAEQLKRYCSIAQQAGYTSYLDQLATVFIAANAPDAPRVTRGAAATDEILAGIYRRSPLRDFDANARLRAEVNRRCATRGRWQDQVQSGDAPPRGRRGLREWVMKDEAYRRFPGKSRIAYARRMAWRRGIEMRQMERACAK